MNVGLVLIQLERHLLLPFDTTADEVPIELVFEEPSHARRAVLLFHHHHRRILRHGFGEERCTLSVRANHLVGPPLVRHLVRRDVERVVHIVRLLDAGDEADGFRVWNRIRQRLGEACITRELDDTHLMVLIWSEVPCVIIERFLDRVDHPLDIPAVCRMIVHGDVDAAVGRLPLIGRHCITSGLKRPQVQDRRIHLVVEESAPTLGPLALEIPRRDGDLIGLRADRGIVLQPVRVVADVIVRADRRIRRRLHARHRWQLLLFSVVVVRELGAGLVSDTRHERRVLDERAVGREVSVVDRVGKASRRAGQIERQNQRITRRERRCQLV